MSAVPTIDWRSKLAKGSIQESCQKRFFDDIQVEKKSLRIQEAVDIHNDAIQALVGRSALNKDIEFKRQQLAYRRKISNKWQEITWQGRSDNYAKRIHYHVGGNNTIQKQELTDKARARREESKATIDQIRREDIFEAIHGEKADLVRKLKTIDPSPWAKALVESDGVIRIDWDTLSVVAGMVSILAGKDLKKMKMREITTALIFNGLAPAWYKVLRYELDLHKAKRSHERKLLIHARDRDGRPGAHRDDRQTRNFRKALAKVNTEVADDPDVKMATADRTVLLTLTSNRDMDANYLKLADQVLDYIREKYGDGCWSANRWECPKATRHLHMSVVIPGDEALSEFEKDEIKEDVYLFWSKMVRQHKTKSGHAVWAVRAAQDIQMPKGNDGIKAIFGYISKRTDAAWKSDKKIKSPSDTVGDIVKADKTAARMRKEGKIQEAEAYESAFLESMPRQQIEDLSSYAPIMTEEDIQEANAFFAKIGRDDLMVDIEDAREVRKVRTRAPFERCWSIGNRKEYKRYIKVVTIELPDDETYWQTRAELCASSNKISEAVKSLNRTKPKMFSCDMEFLLLDNDTVHECINRAIAKVAERRERPKPRCWRPFNKRSIQLPPEDIGYPLRA